MSATAQGNFVIVRCVYAGVHIGYVDSIDGQRVALTDARRLWRWRGANTLHEASKRGVDEVYSRISEPVAYVELLDAIEVIPCESAAVDNLTRSRWPA